MNGIWMKNVFILKYNYPFLKYAYSTWEFRPLFYFTSVNENHETKKNTPIAKKRDDKNHIFGFQK